MQANITPSKIIRFYYFPLVRHSVVALNGVMIRDPELYCELRRVQRNIMFLSMMCIEVTYLYAKYAVRMCIVYCLCRNILNNILLHSRLHNQ